MTLSFFAGIYSKIANFRNSLYKKSVFKSYPLGAKTISVGNITVGGTGKTPLVAFVAEILTANGEKVCVLSRGYGRKNPKTRVLVSDGEKILADAATAGDEPFELAEYFDGKIIIIADADRVAAAKWAREKFSITAFVLDDAFQHQKAKRDLNIVLLDATDPFGGEKTLPAGRLREPLENLKRADVFVLTRANLVGDEEITNFKLRITNYNSHAPVFVSRNKTLKVRIPESIVHSYRTVKKSEFKVQSLKTESRKPNSQLFAFCALGNPDNFFEQLRRENFNLVGVKKFSDHHFYTRKDIENLHLEAEKCGAESFLTTAKDAVKLSGFQFHIPYFVVQNELIFDNEAAFVKLITNKV